MTNDPWFNGYSHQYPKQPAIQMGAVVDVVIVFFVGMDAVPNIGHGKHNGRYGDGAKNIQQVPWFE